MIRIEFDDRIRLIASVLLLTKFVDENSSWKPHPLKEETIKYLSRFSDHPCARASRELAESHWMSAFYCHGVLLEQAARGFALRKEAKPVGYDVSEGLKDFEDKGYSSLLASFYGETDIESFWKQMSHLWAEAETDCRRLLHDSGLSEFLQLFFGRVDYDLLLVPNPVDPPSFGFGPNDGTTSYCILGPPNIHKESSDPVRYAGDPAHFRYVVFHEFAHWMYGRVQAQYPTIVEETAHLRDGMTFKGYFATHYDTWELYLQEIIIRATTALYTGEVDGKASAQAVLERERTEYGIDVIERVYSLLREYLEARKRGEFSDLGEYMPILCKELAG